MMPVTEKMIPVTEKIMNDQTVSLLPGPVSVYPEILSAMAQNLDAGHLEADHLELYLQTGQLLQKLAATRSTPVIMSGEGMLGLWAGLKSCLKPGDAVLSVGTGIFGDGIGDMAANLGCRVEKLSFPYNSTLNQGDALARVEDAIKRLKPKMLTAVHCETPSGTLNPLAELGGLKALHKVPLFYVDAVSSLGGAQVLADEWNIDILLGGTQKCLSATPGICFMFMSKAAWEAARAVNYQGYDALLPFEKLDPDSPAPFPYTPYRHGTAALKRGLEILLNEHLPGGQEKPAGKQAEQAGGLLASGLANGQESGLANEQASGLQAAFRRHDSVARFCREGLARLGIELFPAPGAINSPTVTALQVPQGKDGAAWQKDLQKRGLLLGGSFGPMQGKVLRIGHMGSQADRGLVEKALNIIEESLK